MRFWDASALVPLIVRERTSDDALALHREDPNVLVAWTASIECTSACVRRHRERAISDAQLMSLLTRLRELCSQWHVGEPTAELRSSAERLVGRHGLKAGDAVQLATAVAAATDGMLDFVCFDRRLALAAATEGLRVLPSAPA